MKVLRGCLASGAACVFLAATTAYAQAPQHVHYSKPEGFDKPSPTGQLAPRLQNLGIHKFAVTTKSERAQSFITQGVNLAYGFNHAEAARAFAEAARLDPDCAMAYWGHALVLGPNINAPMNPADEPKAHELVQKAISLKFKASQRERDYIDALAKRYTGKAEDRKAADRAFADAMREHARRYPDDLDAATLSAEALMDLRPWDYWMRDGEPYQETGEIITALESVTRRNPSHPGALHYYIHAVEATKNPERAETAADELVDLMPGAGHMVHMPSHIYMRVGRYSDARESNELAILADEDYITQCRAQGIYPLGYYPHNIHFLWSAATMEGRSAAAIDAAKKVALKVPLDTARQLQFLQGFLVVPYYALTRFGKWEEILSLPRPAHETPFTVGVWHYARGMAFTGKGQLGEAQKELDSLRRILSDKALAEMPASFFNNSAGAILRIAPEVLAGELAAKKGDFNEALLHLEKAVRLEDALVYAEPADWHYPVRQSLGAVLLQAGRPGEAEVVYWDDLRRNPENGWSLFGLMQSLRAQGKNDAAALIEKRFQRAWAGADVKLTASRF